MVLSGNIYWKPWGLNGRMCREPWFLPPWDLCIEVKGMNMKEFAMWLINLEDIFVIEAC